jgi:hypothetical protein
MAGSRNNDNDGDISLPKEWLEPHHSSPQLWTGAALAATTVMLTLGLTAPFVMAKTPLPYMATPSHKIHHALKFLREESQRKVFVDLGSGDGEAVFQAAKLGYQAYGYELNYTLYLLSQLRRRFCWSRQEQKLTHFFCRDFFQSTFPPHTSVVMIFGVTPLMKPLSERLCVEPHLEHVLSYRFALPVNQPGLLQAEIVYDVEEMRVYRVNQERRGTY